MIDAYKTFFDYVGAFFLLYMLGYASFLFLSVIIGSTTLHRMKRQYQLKNEIPYSFYVPISIIVPAYNEAVTIESSIRSLLNLDYPIYEIIVVDDGSNDNTSEVLRNAFHMTKTNRPIHRKINCKPMESIYETRRYKVPIMLIRKQNGGKSDALNMGINASQYPYFVCMDADSVLQADSLERIARPVIEESDVIAVGGAVRPCNGAVIKDGKVISYSLPNKLLPCMQVLEYDRSFLASRMLFDKFNGTIIISGAFGLFKKDVVISAGGYDTTTMGEDMELVVKLHVYCREHNIPYRVKYEPDAICWSQAPESLRDLCKQRRRWHIGLFQTMIKHRRILGNPRYGMISAVSYFYFLLYELLSPYIEIFGVVTILIAFALNLVNVPFMLLFLGIYILYSVVLTLTAFLSRIHTIDLKVGFLDIVKAIGLCGFEVSVLRFILAWVRAVSLIGYRKKQRDWGNITRHKIKYD